MKQPTFRVGSRDMHLGTKVLPISRASNRSVLRIAGAPGCTASGKRLPRGGQRGNQLLPRQPVEHLPQKVSLAIGCSKTIQTRSCLNIHYAPPTGVFSRWSFALGKPQNFLNLQEFPGYTSVRPCLIRHVSTVVPYECHVFVGAKGRRMVVRRKEIAFFSHCWDLPPDKVRYSYSGERALDLRPAPVTAM